MTQRSKCINFQILKRSSIRFFWESLKFSCKVFLNPYYRQQYLLHSSILWLQVCIAALIPSRLHWCHESFVDKILVNCDLNISSMFEPWNLPKVSHSTTTKAEAVHLDQPQHQIHKLRRKFLSKMAKPENWYTVEKTTVIKEMTTIRSSGALGKCRSRHYEVHQLSLCR
jgi:hypothetical protein